MTERLLHFIWQFQYFNKSLLTTEQGETVYIAHHGQYNTNQGPDFSNAKIVIGKTTWAGNVELHLKSSDWHKHAHGGDKNYNNIILHVVWEHDEEIPDVNGNILPTLNLHTLVPKLLLERYEWLMLSQDFVPCQKQLPVLSELGWIAWKERVAIERLQRKSTQVLDMLKQANNHWEEVLWWILTRNFGIKVNADVFETIARSLPINTLAKHKNQVNQLEALLLGQAGLLQGTFTEDYPQLLQREYNFLRKKYKLSTTSVQPFFLRMRPANFPTLRLAQLAMLVYQSSHLFSKLKETQSLSVVKELLDVTANDYWHYHYQFDEPGDYKPKQLGSQMTDNIIINTLVPVLFAYGQYSKEESIKEKALQWLTEVAPEKNIITNGWKTFNVGSRNALESQALIELKNNYCNVKRCLECSVGNTLLKGVKRELIS
jgi:hypothetical protein